MSDNELTGKIIACAIEVHKHLGPELLESVYQDSLFLELKYKNIFVQKEQTLPATYKGTKLDLAFRLDLLVENKIVLELKSVEALNDLHFAQTLTYLKMTNLRIALLMNFNVVVMKNGIRRIVNGY